MRTKVSGNSNWGGSGTGMGARPPATAGDLYIATACRLLESRIAFDSAAAATAADAIHDTAAPAPAEATNLDAPAEPATVPLADALAEAAPEAPLQHADTIVFVDVAIGDPALIAAAAPAGAEIVMLDGGSDGLAEIASYLSDRSPIAAIHIVGHGETGEIRLGNAILTAASAAGEHADELAAIGAVLSASGDILLYGCDVAGSEFGLALLDVVSNATGADVAASDDDTGHADLGGDWDLEIRTGLIEAGLIDAPEWNGLLAPLDIRASAEPTVTGGLGVSGSTGLVYGGAGLVGLWTDAGTIGGTAIDIRATVVSVTPGATVQLRTAHDTDFYGPGRNADDLWVIVNSGTATIRWEIFASGTSQTVAAVGDPNFRISDIDGNPSVTTAFPTNEVEAIAPDVTSLSSYTIDSPTNLLTGVSDGNLVVIGATTQSTEPTSLVGLDWSAVSSWQISYSAEPGWGDRFFFHDGDGDFTFVSPQTTYMLGIDLDANNATASGTGYQATFTENGAGVPVVDTDLAIAQHAALGADIHSATARLTNAQAGDQLLVGGSTAASGTVNGLAYTLTSSGGALTVTLSGAATPAAYHTALQAITFANTSQSPSAIDRNVTVGVTNTTFSTTSNTAVATIHVAAVNDAPVSMPLADRSGADADVVTLDVAGSFADPDSTDTLTFTATGLPPGLAISPTGVVTGTIDHSASVAGPYTVTIAATDSSGATTEQTFTWTITNPDPIAAGDRTSTRESQSVTLDVLSNDRDSDGDRIRLVSAHSSAGTVSIRPNGTLVLTPHPGFAGQATVTYRISDGDGGFATARVVIDVTPNAPALDVSPPSASLARLELYGAVLSAVESASGALVVDTLGRSAADIERRAHRVALSLGLGAVGRAIAGDLESVEPSFARGSAVGPGHREARYASDDRLRPTSGFSIRFGSVAGQADVLAVESMVRSESLLVKLEPVGREVADRIVGYRFTMVDGTPLPSWLEQTRQGLLVGQVPANVETLQLRVIAVMDDGSEQYVDVLIQTRTGEIQRLAGGKRTELPAMFSDQLLADRALSLDEIEALGSMLGRAA